MSIFYYVYKIPFLSIYESFMQVNESFPANIAILMPINYLLRKPFLINTD